MSGFFGFFFLVTSQDGVNVFRSVTFEDGVNVFRFVTFEDVNVFQF